MDLEFWHERWEKGEIGFHQPEVNDDLQRNLGRLELNPGDRIFVPLCGKSLDMRWLLDQGLKVTGVEISRLAVRAFFRETGLRARKEARENYTVYRSDELEILCGDFFDLAPADLPVMDAVYDRASLIALPPEMRQRYVRQMNRLLPVSIRTLLLSLDYPPDEMKGPPFPVTEEEIFQLYGDHRIEGLHSTDILDREPRFRKKGLTRMVESVYLLES